MTSTKSQSTFANRIARLRSPFAQAKSSFVGIEIGVDSVSVAAFAFKPSLKGKRESGSLQWRTDYRFSTGIDPLSDPSPQWISRTIDALVSRLPRCVEGNENIAAISLPLPWVHHQVVLGTELESSQSQCDAMFGNSMFQSDAHLSHWPVVGLQHGQPNQDDQYVVAATAEQAACQIAQAIQEVGYRVESILPHGVALVQAAVPLTSVQAQCVVYCNRTGGIVAMNNGSSCGLCRVLPAVPAQVIRDIDENRLALHDVRPWLSDIAAEINATIRYSNRANMQKDASEPILICGDIVSIPGVDVVLAKLTNQPIATWTYRGRKRPNRRSGAPGTQTTAKVAGDSLCALPLSLAYHASSLAREAQA